MGKASKLGKGIGILFGFFFIIMIFSYLGDNDNFVNAGCASGFYPVSESKCCPVGTTWVGGDVCRDISSGTQGDSSTSGGSSSGGNTNCGGYGKIHASAPSYLYDVVVYVDGTPTGVAGKSFAVPGGNHQVQMGGYNAAGNWIESMTWNIYTDSCKPSTIKWN